MAIDYAKFREAAIAKGVPAKEVDAFIKKKQTEELARQGVLDVGDIATSDPSTALKLTQEGIKPKGSAEEQKQAQKMTDLEQSVGLLEKNYREIEATGPVKGRATKLLSGLTGGAVAPEIADYEALRQSMIGPLARAISGEVGVLTDRDIGRAENLLPKVGDTPKVAEKKLNNLKTIIAEKTGKEPELQPEPKGENILSKILRTSRRFGQDVGAGLALRGEAGQQLEQSREATMDAASRAEEAALRAETPEEKQRLLEVARAARGQVSTGVEKAEQAFSPEVGRDYLSRGLDVGSEIAFAAEIPGIVKGLPNLANRIKNIKSPERMIGAVRDEAVKTAEKQGVKFKTSGITKAAKEYIKDDPLAAKTYEKIAPSISKELSPSQLMNKLKVWNKAYTSASKVGKSSKAGLYDVLARSAKEEIAKKAPEISKATDLFSKYYRTKKATSRLVTPAVGAAGAGIGATALYKLLGR